MAARKSNARIGAAAGKVSSAKTPKLRLGGGSRDDLTDAVAAKVSPAKTPKPRLGGGSKPTGAQDRTRAAAAKVSPAKPSRSRLGGGSRDTAALAAVKEQGQRKAAKTRKKKSAKARA